MTAATLEKLRQLVNAIRNALQPPSPIPETQSAYRPRARRNASRRHGSRTRDIRWTKKTEIRPHPGGRAQEGGSVKGVLLQKQVVS